MSQLNNLPISKPADVQVFDVSFSKSNGAKIRIVETLNQLNARRLATTRATDQCHRLPLTNGQVQASQNLFGTSSEYNKIAS